MHAPGRWSRPGRRWVAWMLLVVLLAACGGGSPSAAPASTPNGPGPGVTTSPPSTRTIEKVDEVFLHVLLIYQAQGLDAARQFARDQGILTPKEDLRVTLVLDSDDPAVVDGTALAVGRLGGRVTATYGNQVEIVVPVQAALEYGKAANKQSFFADLADFSHIRDVRRTPLAQPMVAHAPRPMPARTTAPRTTDGTSEGVAYTGADRWQAAGITGKGVKVGVIDGGFNRYKRILGGATVTVKSFRADGLIEDRADDETIHGTACAEIVHEMAPDAELYLVAVDTPGEFVKGTAYLVGVGVSVISSSLGFDGDNPVDGTSPLAVAVDKAKASGIFFVNAAGNSASGDFGSDSEEGHFGATFQDSDGDGFHDFPGAKNANALAVRLTGEPFTIALNWNDWQQPARANYALYLYDRAGQEVARSDTDHLRRHKPPVQEISGTVAAGTYLVKIRKMRADTPDLPFNLYFDTAQLEMTTPAGSLTVPADARGSVAVAAIDVQTDEVEKYSSRGPTLDGRIKPDLGAPDNVSSLAYGLTADDATFTGTSAAAPHVAGAAALVLQAFPALTPDGVLAFFAAHARQPRGSEGGDQSIGNGRLDLDTVPTDASRALLVAYVPATSTTPIRAG